MPNLLNLQERSVRAFFYAGRLCHRLCGLPRVCGGRVQDGSGPLCVDRQADRLAAAAAHLGIAEDVGGPQGENYVSWRAEAENGSSEDVGPGMRFVERFKFSLSWIGFVWQFSILIRRFYGDDNATSNRHIYNQVVVCLQPQFSTDRRLKVLRLIDAAFRTTQMLYFLFENCESHANAVAALTGRIMEEVGVSEEDVEGCRRFLQVRYFPSMTYWLLACNMYVS